ncbi:MAG TPA: hypothetical protein EYP60_06240 [bacterium (Candidatus Stahlbacteria)]|nr:hypothetical protein [Candidatus Stahlbacteria bacterium]
MTLFLIILGLTCSLPHNPRALALSNAYTSIAFGFDAPLYNPANLGSPKNPKFSLRVLNGWVTPIGILSIYPTYNSSFSLSEFDSYFYSGRYLDDATKQNILNSIPNKGFSMGLDAGIGILELSFKSFALSLRAFSGTKNRIPKDVFDLILFGNKLGKEYNYLENLEIETLSYGTLTLSYGRMVAFGETPISLGVGFRSMGGLFYGVVDEAMGSLDARDTTHFDASGEIKFRAGLGGYGFGLDFGILSELSNGWSFSLAILNANRGMNWNGSAIEGSLTFRAESLSIINVINKGMDTLVTSTTEIDELKSIRSALPSFLRIGIAGRLNPNILLVADIVSGLSNTPLSSTKPELCVGLEWTDVDFLKMRAGLALGGEEGFIISYGFGLRIWKLHLDVGIQNIRGILLWSKGGRMSFNLGIFP